MGESRNETGPPILRTKLHRPPVAPDVLPRGRLLDRLNEGRHLPMTLISAPAGYGKSTLASRWLEACDQPSAWLSLDEEDNDLRQFLSYLLAAVDVLFPGAVQETYTLLDAGNMPAPPVVARSLLNELAAVEAPFILALDDYHRIDNHAVHHLLTELLRHPPETMHLVLLTRRDPPLPISTLRARGQMKEVAANDLRFTAEETAAFLGNVLHIPVEDATAAVLERKTEGWVTGLRLAALSLRAPEDVGRLAARLEGSSFYVAEYLVGEVLARQPDALAAYVTQTSILDRFCAPLCDALHPPSGDGEEDRMDGAGFIEWLCASNLFVIPLGERRQWLRYHHLFQQLLRERLKRQASGEHIARLHARASKWFEGAGLPEEAIRHALAAGDEERAAGIVETFREAELTADRWYVLERWLAMLPAHVKQERPKLLLSEAWILSCRYQYLRIPAILERVESILDRQAAEPTVLGEIDSYRGHFAYLKGQAERSRQFLEDAVSRLSEGRTPFLGEAELMLGLARCMEGRQDLAVQALERRIKDVGMSEGQLLSRLVAGLVFIHLVCGDLANAGAQAENLQLVARRFGMPVTDAWSSYMWGCTHLHAGRLEPASRHFGDAVKQRHVLESRAAIDAFAGLALAQQLMQEPDAAAATTRGLQAFAQELNDPQYLCLARSCQTRLSLLLGETRPAAELAQTIGEMPDPASLFMWLEVPPITQARARIATGSEQDLVNASTQLQSIRDLSEACRFTCQTIEAAVLQSVAFDAQNRDDEALASLGEAVQLAKAGRWVRPFVEAGRPMSKLLKRLDVQNEALAFVEELRAAIGQDGQTPHSAEAGIQGAQPLVDPLTKRELVILSLMAKGLSNKEIAGKLFVSTDTVKKHLYNTYQKLNAHNRVGALAKARDLGIVPPS